METEMGEMRKLLGLVAERGARYVEGAGGRRVSATQEAIDRLGVLREGFPQEPSDARSILEILDEVGSPATTAMTGGRYFGFVIGGVLPAALAANWLAGAWGQNAC